MRTILNKMRELLIEDLILNKKNNMMRIHFGHQKNLKQTIIITIDRTLLHNILNNRKEWARKDNKESNKIINTTYQSHSSRIMIILRIKFCKKQLMVKIKNLLSMIGQIIYKIKTDVKEIIMEVKHHKWMQSYQKKILKRKRKCSRLRILRITFYHYS